MNAKEKAKILRQELKEIGVKASVRTGGGSIRVAVKNFAVSLKEIKEIARRYEKIHRCEYSGEILSGGNTYVSVSYNHDFMDIERKKYLELTREIFEKAKKLEGQNEAILVAYNDEYSFLFYDAQGNRDYDLVAQKKQGHSCDRYCACNEYHLSESLAIIDNLHNLNLLEQQ